MQWGCGLYVLIKIFFGAQGRDCHPWVDSSRAYPEAKLTDVSMKIQLQTMDK